MTSKIYIMIICILVLVCSCTMYQNYNWRIDVVVNTIEDAKIIMGSIAYKTDIDNSDVWKLPHQTYTDKVGDCEDQAALLANIMIHNLNYTDVKLVIANPLFILNPYTRHMLVYANGKYYEGTTAENAALGYEIEYELTYAEYINYALVKQ